MTYNYDLKFEAGPYHVEIDTQALYGWFEHERGGEGGLWFERTDAGIELVDYDGVFTLPHAVAAALREQGYIVSDDCE